MSPVRLFLLAAVGTVLMWTAAAAGPYDLVVSTEGEEVIERVRLAPRSTIILEYTNSLYMAPTEEHFIVRRGGFALREVWSTSDAVLASHSLPAPYARRGAFFVSSVEAFVPRIVTRIGPVGQQTLRVGDREVPLFRAGTGAQVIVALRRPSPPELLLRMLNR